MHEFSIVSSLLDLIEAEVSKHRATAATRVVVQIGEMSGVVAELLADAFHVCKVGTVAAEAELVIEHQKVQISCRCGYQGPIAERHFTCPVCEVAEVEVVAGEEMMLQQLELETEN